MCRRGVVSVAAAGVMDGEGVPSCLAASTDEQMAVGVAQESSRCGENSIFLRLLSWCAACCCSSPPPLTTFSCISCATLGSTRVLSVVVVLHFVGFARGAVLVVAWPDFEDASGAGGLS
jgi:hypothetical protein